MINLSYSRKLIIPLILLTSFSALTAHKTTKGARQLKQEAWNAKATEVDKWGDGLGLGIDVGIKETVIVLNLLGFKTAASCQGHMDRGVPAPWIDFDLEDSEMNGMQKEFTTFLKELQKKESELEQKYPSASDMNLKEEALKPLWKKRIEMGNQLERLSREKMMALRDVINRFYKKHGYRTYDKILLLHQYYSSFYRLMSNGVDWQVVYDEKERHKKLKEYQEEMRLFTAFLKDYYFSDAYSVPNR